MKIATIAAIAATSLAIASGASAATLLPPTVGSSTTLSLTPVAASTQTFGTGNATDTSYYYTFNTLGNYKIDVTSTGNLLANNPENPFVITAGTTPGAGTVVATSSFGVTSSDAKAILAKGYYTVTISGVQPNEALSSTVSVAAVPEPAAWALMIVGFAGIGGAVRRRSSVASVATA